MDKIFISGTGRCGTTFLMKLFTLLDYKTGYDKKTYLTHVFKNCNSGLEIDPTRNSKELEIFKSPKLIADIDDILKKNKDWLKLKLMIIPVRNYEKAAQSRVKHGHRRGGLWNAKDKQTQIRYYKNIIADYVHYMLKHNINTIFLDFDEMVSNKEYLYVNLKPLFMERNITFEKFSDAYDKASATSKPKKE